MNLRGMILSEKSQSQGLNTVRSHLDNILEIIKLQKWRRDQWSAEVKEREKLEGSEYGSKRTA